MSLYVQGKLSLPLHCVALAGTHWQWGRERCWWDPLLLGWLNAGISSQFGRLLQQIWGFSKGRVWALLLCLVSCSMASAHSSPHLSLPGCQQPGGLWRRCDWHPAQRCRGEIRAKAHMEEFPSALWLGCSHLHKPDSSFSNYEKNVYLNPKPCCRLSVAALSAIRRGKSSVTHCWEGRVADPADTCLCRLENWAWREKNRPHLLTTAWFQLVC